MVDQKGTISIHTENIFPIIKRSLYSDTEIFIRELASNAVDACSKLRKVAPLAGIDLTSEELAVNVTIDKDAKTITFSDNGIGMSAHEVDRYINQIAFSGASEFIEKFKEAGTKREEIIGNFGLGFYSSFMVSSRVVLTTKSYLPGEEAVRWECDGSTEFTLTSTDKESRGTDVTLFLDADSEEFLEEYRVREALRKYCRFLPVTVKFAGESVSEKALWVQSPQGLTDQDYLDFYKVLYPMADEPVFWIHLNVDYPFTLNGILYFPKVSDRFELEREKIQLYSRQVFITEDVKGIVPDYLMLLHGVIDSPDIPLNVSRSSLQSDQNVKKINQYVTRKVADKLGEIFNQDREGFEKKWDAVGFFVKYGMVAEPKFAEKAKPFVLVEDTHGKRWTLDEYKAHTGLTQTDKGGQTVWLYTQAKDQQAPFIEPLEERGYNVLTFSHPIDPHFLQHLEGVLEGVRIKRVDSDSPEKLIEKETPTISALTEDEQKRVADLFTETLKDTGYTFATEALLSTDLPVSLTKNEFMLRMEEMAKIQGGGPMMFGNMPGGTMVVNTNHPAVSALLNQPSEEARTKRIRHLFDMALLSQGKLSGKALSAFVKRTAELI